MPLYAGIAVERPRAARRARSACRCGAAPRAARVRLGTPARAATCPSTSSSTTATSTARTSTARPTEAYPDNLERFTFLSRGALELCKALGFIPDVIHAQRLADGAGAGLRQHRRVGAAAARRGDASTRSTTWPTRACSTAARCSSPASAASTTTRASSSTSATLNLTKAALCHSTLLSTVSPTYAREIQTRAYGFGLDGVLRGRSGDLRRHPERHRRRGVEPGDRPAPAGALRRRRPGRQGRVQGGAAAGGRAAGAPRRAALRRSSGASTPQKGFDVLAHALRAHPRAGTLQFVLLGTGDPDAERFFARGRARSAATASRAWHRLRRRPRAPHRGRRRLLPDAVALRAVRPEPDVQPALRHAADRARDRRPRRHRARTTTSATGERHRLRVRRPARPTRSPTPSAGRVSTWYDRPEHIAGDAPRAPWRQDFSWDRAAREYEQLYLDAYQRRRGHAFRLGA